MLMVQLYDKSVMTDIEKAIMASGIWLKSYERWRTYSNPLPILTEERRKELVKIAKDKSEQARISIRNSRREANDQIKKAVEEHLLPEDSKFEAEDDAYKQ